MAASLLVLLFVLVTCFNTYRHCFSMKFELMPMTLNLLATLLITFLCIVQENYEYGLVVEIVEIYTYFFFTFSFAMVLLKLKAGVTER